MASLVDQSINDLYQEAGNGLYVVKLVRFARGKTEIVNGWASKEDFNITLQSTYAGVSMGNWIDSKVAGMNGLLAATGVQFNSQFMTARLYQNTPPPNFQITLNFVAYKDSYKDVIVPTTQLMRLLLPEQINSFMIAVPGPTAVGQFVNMMAPIIGKNILGNDKDTVDRVNKASETGEVMSFSIGKWLRIAPVIISKASVNIPPQYDKNGNPIRATVSLEILPFYTPYKNQLPLPGDSAQMYDSKVPMVFQYGSKGGITN